MKTHLLLLFVIPFFGFSQSTIPTLEEFQAECDSAGLEFNMPEGFSIAEVKENKDLFYSFAISNSDKSMEIRYTIWPLGNLFDAYEKSLKDSNVTMVNPNNMYYARVQASMTNLSGGQIYNITKFPPAAVEREFHANQGGSCFFEFDSEFGKGWLNGQFIYLHKENQADVIITFMSLDKEKHSDLMEPAFHSLKFKADEE